MRLRCSASRVAARAVLTAGVVVGVMGCTPGYVPREIITDARGCKWAAVVVRFSDGDAVMRDITPLKDSDGKPIASTDLYKRNHREASWFKACVAGQFTTRMPFTSKDNENSTGTFIEDMHVDADVQQAYAGDDGLTVGFSAPVRDASGNVIAFWTNRSKFSMTVSLVMMGSSARLTGLASGKAL